VSVPVARKTMSKSLLKRENEGRVLRSPSSFMPSPPSDGPGDTSFGGLDEGREMRQVKRYMAMSWASTSNMRLLLTPLALDETVSRLKTRFTQTSTARRLTTIIEPISTSPTSRVSLPISSSMLKVDKTLATMYVTTSVVGFRVVVEAGCLTYPNTKFTHAINSR